MKLQKTHQSITNYIVVFWLRQVLLELRYWQQKIYTKSIMENREDSKEKHDGDPNAYTAVEAVRSYNLLYSSGY